MLDVDIKFPFSKQQSHFLNHCLQLSMENVRLRRELEELQSRRSVLDDETVISQIEQAFEQFNKFLDLLRDVGY